MTKLGSKSSGCVEAAIGLGPEDTSRLMELHQLYADAGLTSDAALRKAANDLVAELNEEATDITKAVQALMAEGEGRQSRNVGREGAPRPANQGAIQATADRFGLTLEEVSDIVGTPVDELRRRDEYIAPSNTKGPTQDFERHAIGTAKINLYGDPMNAYVHVLREFDPKTLVPTEAESGIKQTPIYQGYAEWARQGKEPPPIQVFDGRGGKFNTSDRRRTLAAQEAGRKSIKGWYSPDNKETGNPLKLGDVIAAYETASTSEPAREYPIAPRDEWYGEGAFSRSGGRMVYVTPDEYLAAVRPLTMDDESRENIDLLKEHIESGKTLDPLLIRASGKEDGRHRAHAAKELGIGRVPVIVYGDQFSDKPTVPAEAYGGNAPVLPLSLVDAAVA
jgi:hypothetical protein